MKFSVLRLLFVGILICQLTSYTGAASVALAWDPNLDSSLAGYNIYRSLISGSGYSRLNSALVPSPSYTDNAAASGEIYYYVVTAVNTLGLESGYSNEVTATINGVPDLAISKIHGGSFTVGTNGDYTLTVQNVGSSPTTGTITVTDTLPTGLSFVSASGSGWSFFASGQSVTCFSAGPVSAGGSTSFTLTVGVASAAVPSVTNTATVSTPSDTNAANDTAIDPTTVISAPNHPPTANAGPDQVVRKSSTVMLLGSGSDPDGDALTFSWAQVSGPTVLLFGANTAVATFTAPGLQSTTYLAFRLTVSDGRGGVATDDVKITVTNKQRGY